MSPIAVLRKSLAYFVLALALSIAGAFFCGYQLGKVRGAYLLKASQGGDLALQNALLQAENEKLRLERDIGASVNPAKNQSAAPARIDVPSAGELEIVRANITGNGSVYAVDILLKNGRGASATLTLLSDIGKIEVPLSPKSHGKDGAFNARFAMPNNFTPSSAVLLVHKNGETSFDLVWRGGREFSLIDE